MIASTTIATPTIQWSAISPELILVGASLLLLLLAVIVRGPAQRPLAFAIGALAFIAAPVAVALIWDKGAGDWLVMSHELRVDRFGNAMRLLISLVGLATLVAAYSWESLEDRAAEFTAIVLLASAGMGFLAVANSFVALFVSLELFSIALYTLVAFDTRSRFGLEGALKYLIMGGVGSAVLVYGSSLVYGATGSLRFNEIALKTSGAPKPLLYAGIALVLVGLVFKVGAAPFHMWTPDVYEGAPTPITGFMAAATKIAAFAVLMRFLVEAAWDERDVWRVAIAGIAVISMYWGNIAALVQTNVKRILAYSSVANAGYLLVGIAAIGSQRVLATGAQSAIIVFLAAYAATTVAAFALVGLAEREIGGPATLDSMRGWGYRRPLPATLLSILLLSLAGFPPTAGFIIKFGVFGSAVSVGSTTLAILAVLAAAISLGYYLRLGLVIWDRAGVAGEDATEPVRVPRLALATATGLALVGVAIVAVIGLWPEPVIEWARHAAQTVAATRPR